MNTSLAERKTGSENWIYIAKNVMGVAICFYLYKTWPQYSFSWSIISVVLALSPDNSNEHAYNRIKANILGCGIGVILYAIPMPQLFTLCTGVAVTIIASLMLKTASTIKSALAAILIVLLQKDHGNGWEICIERVLCVITGCLVVFLLTISFSLFRKHKTNQENRL